MRMKRKGIESIISILIAVSLLLDNLSVVSAASYADPKEQWGKDPQSVDLMSQYMELLKNTKEYSTETVGLETVSKPNTPDSCIVVGTTNEGPIPDGGYNWELVNTDSNNAAVGNNYYRNLSSTGFGNTQAVIKQIQLVPNNWTMFVSVYVQNAGDFPVVLGITEIHDGQYEGFEEQKLSSAHNWLNYNRSLNSQGDKPIMIVVSTAKSTINEVRFDGMQIIACPPGEQHIFLPITTNNWGAMADRGCPSYWTGTWEGRYKKLGETIESIATQKLLKTEDVQTHPDDTSFVCWRTDVKYTLASDGFYLELLHERNKSFQIPTVGVIATEGKIVAEDALGEIIAQSPSKFPWGKMVAAEVTPYLIITGVAIGLMKSVEEINKQIAPKFERYPPVEWIGDSTAYLRILRDPGEIPEKLFNVYRDDKVTDWENNIGILCSGHCNETDLSKSSMLVITEKYYGSDCITCSATKAKILKAIQVSNALGPQEIDDYTTVDDQDELDEFWREIVALIDNGGPNGNIDNSGDTNKMCKHQPRQGLAKSALFNEADRDPTFRAKFMYFRGTGYNTLRVWTTTNGPPFQSGSYAYVVEPGALNTQGMAMTIVMLCKWTDGLSHLGEPPHAYWDTIQILNYYKIADFGPFELWNPPIDVNKPFDPWGDE